MDEQEDEKWSKEEEKSRKPGQKFHTPSPGYADRVFYESLYHQNPSSLMAMKWCVEHGIFSREDALKVIKKLEAKGVKVAAVGFSSPSSAKKKAGGSVKKEKKVKNERSRVDNSTYTTGMEGGAFEGVGVSGF